MVGALPDTKSGGGSSLGIKCLSAAFAIESNALLPLMKGKMTAFAMTDIIAIDGYAVSVTTSSFRSTKAGG